MIYQKFKTMNNQKSKFNYIYKPKINYKLNDYILELFK